MIEFLSKNLHSDQTAERVGDEYFRHQGRVKVNRDDFHGEARWYLEDGTEFAIVSRRSLEILHFRRTPAGWLAFDPIDGDV